MLRLGVIGMGFGGAVVLPGLCGHDRVSVVALADNGSGRAARAASSLGPQVTVHNSGDDLIARAEVDAVIIACPPAGQYDLARAALERSLHVLCEKPLGLTLAQAQDLTDLAQSRHRVGAVGYEMRYEPGITALAAVLRQGRIGDLRRVMVTWMTAGGANPARPWTWRDDSSQGGGNLSEFASHVLDYLTWMAGRVDVVGASTVIRVPQRRDAAGISRAVNAEDEVGMLLRFEQGAEGVISVGNASPWPLGHRIELIGTRGRAQFHLRPPYGGDDASLVVEDATGSESIVLPADHGDSRIAAYGRLVTDFTAAIRGDGNHALPRFADAAAIRALLDRADVLAHSNSVRGSDRL